MHSYVHSNSVRNSQDMETTYISIKGQTCGFQGGSGGMDWEFEVDRCKLSHLEWINNKVLLYSTRNYIRSPVTNHIRQEYEEDCIDVYN